MPTTIFGAYTRVTRLSNAALPRFGATLVGEGDPCEAIAHRTLQDPSGLAADLPDAAQTLFAESLPPMRREVRRRGPEEAGRSVYVMPKLPVGPGHAVALMTFAPLGPAAQTSLMASNNLMRLVVTAFPASGASFTDEQMRSALGGPARELKPRNVRRPFPKQVIARNAALYRQDAQVLGPHLLGNNSWTQALAHLRGEKLGMSWQAVVHTTTSFHSQDGTLVWLVARHPEYPEGLAWLSVHYGQHPVPAGDTVNAWLAPLLFHPTFQRAVRLGSILPALADVCGQAAVDELMLNKQVARQVRRLENHADRRRQRQSRVLNVMDRVGGLLLNSARWSLKD